MHYIIYLLTRWHLPISVTTPQQDRKQTLMLVNSQNLVSPAQVTKHLQLLLLVPKGLLRMSPQQPLY